MNVSVGGDIDNVRIVLTLILLDLSLSLHSVVLYRTYFVMCNECLGLNCTTYFL